MGTDKENTFRALRDEPLIASFWCRFKMHRWEKWVAEEPHNFGGDTYVRLSRKCVGCGLLEFNTIKRRNF